MFNFLRDVVFDCGCVVLCLSLPGVVFDCVRGVVFDLPGVVFHFLRDAVFDGFVFFCVSLCA